MNAGKCELADLRSRSYFILRGNLSAFFSSFAQSLIDEKNNSCRCMMAFLFFRSGFRPAIPFRIPMILRSFLMHKIAEIFVLHLSFSFPS